MIIPFTELRATSGIPRSYKFIETPGPLDIGGTEITFYQPLEVLLEAVYDGRVVSVSGRAQTKIQLQCCCCLEKFIYPVEIGVNEKYIPSFNVRQNEGEDLAKDEPELHIFSGNEINVKDTIMENIIISLPMKPKCHKDCRGLCPQCGANLNKDDCNCSEQTTDSRLAVLEKLLHQGMEK